MPRSSYLLNFCSGFAVLCSLQIFTSWIWVDLNDANWGIAWCDSSSSMARWLVLYSWAITGIFIVFNWLKGKIATAYKWTIVSFVLFWSIGFSLASLTDRNDPSGLFALAIFFVCMIWSLQRYKKRQASINETREQDGGLNALSRVSHL
ncbi:MAG: hypothetical protein ACSHX0_10590 [Akkermansiaceae bacterium]